MGRDKDAAEHNNPGETAKDETRAKVIDSGKGRTRKRIIYRAGGRDGSESRQGEVAEVERAKGVTTTKKGV